MYFPGREERELRVKLTRMGKAKEESEDRIANEPAVPLYRQTSQL
jgi:hypothetical protein